MDRHPFREQLGEIGIHAALSQQQTVGGVLGVTILARGVVFRTNIEVCESKFRVVPRPSTPQSRSILQRGDKWWRCDLFPILAAIEMPENSANNARDLLP